MFLFLTYYIPCCSFRPGFWPKHLVLTRLNSWPSEPKRQSFCWDIKKNLGFQEQKRWFKDSALEIQAVLTCRISATDVPEQSTNMWPRWRNHVFGCLLCIRETNLHQQKVTDFGRAKPLGFKPVEAWRDRNIANGDTSRQMSNTVSAIHSNGGWLGEICSNLSTSEG